MPRTQKFSECRVSCFAPPLVRASSLSIQSERKRERAGLCTTSDATPQESFSKIHVSIFYSSRSIYLSVYPVYEGYPSFEVLSEELLLLLLFFRIRGLLSCLRWRRSPPAPAICASFSSSCSAVSFSYGNLSLSPTSGGHPRGVVFPSFSAFFSFLARLPAFPPPTSSVQSRSLSLYVHQHVALCLCLCCTPRGPTGRSCVCLSGSCACLHAPGLCRLSGLAQLYVDVRCLYLCMWMMTTREKCWLLSSCLFLLLGGILSDVVGHLAEGDECSVFSTDARLLL